MSGPTGSAGRRPGAAPITVLFPFVGDVVGGSHISALSLAAALDRRLIVPRILLHRGDGPLES